MIIDEIDGFIIWEHDRPGKAVHRAIKTSVIQVRRYVPASGGFVQMAQYQYLIGNEVKRELAMEKARNYIKNYKKC